MGKKDPIGKILVEKKKINQDGLGQALEHQHRDGGRLASQLLDLGLAGEEDLLLALAEQQGVPAVDLAGSIIALRFLDLIPEEVASKNNIMPLRVDEDRVLLAMSNPDDQSIIDEIHFITGKKVDPQVVLEARVKNVIREAYALRKRDASLDFYRGERSSVHEDKADPDGYLAVLSNQLPEPDVQIDPDEDLISIEVDLGDEVAAISKPASLEEKSQDLILVVDDEEDIVRMLEKALKAEGFAVDSATRGLEALQKVKALGPSLVLLDAMLPEIHGFEICKKIKSSKRFGHIPVIIISAIYRGWRYAEDVKSTYGADDFFEKPFRVVPLMRRIHDLLNQSSSKVDAEVDPDAANQAYRQGVASYNKKKYQDAEKFLEQACQLDPFSANVHYARASVYLAQGKLYEAIQEYESTVELKPDLFAPLRNLAILYQKKGFKNKALEMWERALRCSPDEPTRKEVKSQLIKLL